MKKLAVVFTQEPSSWTSCRAISSNLLAAYRGLSGDFTLREFPLSERRTQEDLQLGTGYVRSFLEGISSFRPDKLIIVDHTPHPWFLLSSLHAMGSAFSPRLETIVHVYGDFSYFAKQWQRLGVLMHGRRFRMVCASPKQASFVAQTLAEREDHPTVVPFPIDTRFFRFNQRERESSRKALGIRRGERVLIYAGRLSLQKNIVRIIDDFAKLLPRVPSAKLLFAGAFDDLGAPTLGVSTPLGYHFNKVRFRLESLPEKARERISFVGHQGRRELRSLFCAADAFYSPSLYHDEDFGMAPAEALACGLPAVLTDWGGYSAFQSEGVAAKLVPIKLVKSGYVIDSVASNKALLEILSKPLSDLERRRSGNHFSRAFSPSSVARILEKELNAPVRKFGGFNWRLPLLQAPQELDRDRFYGEAYRPYYALSDGTRLS